MTRFIYPEKSRPYLHGEIVGVGLLLQNHFNGEKENNTSLLSLMKQYGMPHSITDIGIEKSSESLGEYYDRLCGTSAVNGKDESECRRLRKSLEYLWEIV